MMKSSDIREQFLAFFRSKGHTIVPSAPIVIKNDPTLLFTNAGMNQFKDYFLGNRKPSDLRVADTQKCLRVSGKHNDLEEVGVDTYHHTMFEMLGNWSFGDYFKKEAIAWSWELLTEVYKLDKERIYVTVFAGDEKEGLAADEEAFEEWKKHIAEERILRGSKKDNFWEMGDTGPCGPCSEIHFDSRLDADRQQVSGKTLVNNDHPQVIEIWNNVFMQFNRQRDGRLEQLPAKHVDTGMGFERLVRVIQGVQSNYDTDIFLGIISTVESIINQQYKRDDSKRSVAFRVIADHIRAISFTIADGQLPSNTGAGYVIRRILRRAVRYYYSTLGYSQPLLHQLVPYLSNEFAQVFPELAAQQDFIMRVIREEEEAFLRTLDKGLKKLEGIISELRKGKEVKASTTGSSSETIDGKVVFELYDTCGFPADLTRLIAKEENLDIDEAGFQQEMQQQKSRSRAATAVDTEDWVIVSEIPNSQFVGYHDIVIDTEISRVRKVKAKGKEQFQVVLATTPFYAESGGQVGDTGTLYSGEEVIPVTDTRKENNLVIHFTDQLPSDLSLPVKAVVNFEARLNTMYNHTATHLLHAALREVLGQHVAQKGSMVSPELLRFDFSHFSKLTDEEIRRVEMIVNNKIRQNIPVTIRELPKEEALKLGAMALFGEKYGNTVRVVTADPDFSIELCGGTHVPHTGMIGVFTILSESAVAAGVRRIEAITGATAMSYFMDKLGQFKYLNDLLRTKEPLKAVEKLMEERASLEKKIEGLEARQLVQIRNELLTKDEIINGITFVGDIVEVGNPDALKKLCFDLKTKLHDYVAVVAANIGGKPFVAIGISDTVVAAKNLDAAKLIKEIVAPIIKGGGGGQKNLATAGGQEAGQLGRVIEEVRARLKD